MCVNVLALSQGGIQLAGCTRPGGSADGGRDHDPDSFRDYCQEKLMPRVLMANRHERELSRINMCGSGCAHCE